MREFYRVTTSVIVDNDVQIEEKGISWKLRDSKPDDECYSVDVNNYTELPWRGSVLYGRSAIRHRPYIRINTWSDYQYKIYIYKHNINLVVKWDVATNYSLNEVIKNASACDAIEYFKERGMAVCPIERK